MTQTRAPLIMTLIVSLLAFFIINTPSIKIIYRSELINVAAVCCLWGAGLYKLLVMSDGRMLFGKLRAWFILLFASLWILLMLYGSLAPDSEASLRLFLQYAGVFGAVVGLLLFVTRSEEIRMFLLWQIVWAVLLAIVQLTVGIELDRAENQHYLTLGVPLAAGLVSIFGYILPAERVLAKIVLLAPAAVITMGLATLFGRAPILFSTGTIIVFWLMVIWKHGSLPKKIAQLLLLLGTGVAVYLILKQNVSDYWLYRFEKLQNVGEESRMTIYRTAFEMIARNPFGYGMNASDAYIGIYPHNILLETMISGGIGSLLLLLGLIAMFVHVIGRSVKTRTYLIPCCMLATYLLLTWNVSFNLTGAYTPIGAIAISIVAWELLQREQGGKRA